MKSPGVSGVGRLVFAGALGYDWFIRFTHRDMFYGTDGAMPQALVPARQLDWYFSIFDAAASPFTLALCMLVGLAGCLGIVFQPSSRWWPALAMIFQVSLANRHIASGYCCFIYAAVLIWMIISCGRQGDVPVVRDCYAFQLGLIYFTTAFARLTPGSEWLDGSAMARVAGCSLTTTPLGTALLDSLGHSGLVLATYMTMAVEFLGLPLLLWPASRRAGIVMLTVFHCITAVTMALAELPYLMIGALLMAWPDPQVRREVGAAQQLVLGKAARAVLCVLLVVTITLDSWNRVLAPTLRTRGVAAPALSLSGHDYVIGLLGLYQSWTMFASLPDVEIWPVVACRTKRGEEFNLLDGRPLDWSLPPSLATYLDQRICKYYCALYAQHAQGDSRLAKACLAYLTRAWNQRHPENPVQDLLLWYGWTPSRGTRPAGWVRAS